MKTSNTIGQYGLLISSNFDLDEDIQLGILEKSETYKQSVSKYLQKSCSWKQVLSEHNIACLTGAWLLNEAF